MKKITAVRAGKGRGKRINVFLDGRRAFNLDPEVAVRRNLRVGQELADSEIETLVNSDNYYRCINAALQYLGFRPRSEYELRERLHQRGFLDECIETVISKLKEQGLVDDVAFARFWKDNRELLSPRSRWLTRVELKQKGVAEEIIAGVIESIEDGDSAYRAALSRVRSLSRSDYATFYRRLADYLRRRGFDYGVIKSTVQVLWREWGNGSGSD